MRLKKIADSLQYDVCCVINFETICVYYICKKKKKSTQTSYEKYKKTHL
jgi:hypothetical protein